VVSAEFRAVVEGIYRVKDKAVSLQAATVVSIRHSLLECVRGLIASDFIRHVVATLTNRLLLLSIGIITSVMVARILGPEGRGAYAVAMGIGALGVQAGNLGLHASNTYTVAKKPELLSTLVMNSVAVGIGLGGFAAAAVGAFFTLWPHLAPLQGLFLWMSLGWIPLGLCYLFTTNLLLGIQDVKAYNKIELGAKIFSVVLIGIVIWTSFVTAETVFVAGLLALGLSLVCTFRILHRHGVHLTRPALSLFTGNLGYSIRGYVAAFFSFVALRLDVLLIQYLLDAEQAGYYSVAVSLTDVLYMLPVTVGAILFPKLSGMPEDAERWQYAKKVVGIVAVLMAGIAIVALFGARPLITILYGVPFEPATAAFVWLLPGIVLLSVSSLLMNYLASMGMPPVVMYSAGLAALANLALNVKLIPLWGIVGASVSMTVSAGIMLIVAIAYIAFVQGRTA
jgi:O-antigen/teichoic acid export membrane protein